MFTWALVKMVGGSVWGVLSKIPARVWLYLGLAAALALWHFDLQHKAVEAAVAANEAKHQKTDLARALAQKKANDAAQAKLDDLAGRLVQAQLDENDAQAARDAADSALAQALNERSRTYVTPTQNARCPDVPRGFLLLWADAAAYANGASDARPSAAPGESADARSGVSLAPVIGQPLAGPYLSDTLDAAAVAFRQLKAKLDDERRAADNLRTACTSTIHILKGATP